MYKVGEKNVKWIKVFSYDFFFIWYYKKYILSNWNYFFNNEFFVNVYCKLKKINFDIIVGLK